MQRTLDTGWNFGMSHESSSAVLTKPGRKARLTRWHKEALYRKKQLETRKSIYRNAVD